MLKTSLLLIALGFALLGSALGYGNAGHQAVGIIAEHYLAGTRAETEVHNLLKPGEGLDRAATWADRAKLPDKYLTAEMKDFVTNNPGHHGYHYCDVPFQEKAYRDGITGTNDHDIVHSLRLCIAVLQSPQDDLQNPLKINKRVALMLITHYMGDLHQPLHVGCSYIDEHDQYVNPETGAKGQSDAGANYLRVTTRSSLHAYWDTQTVKLARDHAKLGDDPPDGTDDGTESEKKAAKLAEQQKISKLFATYLSEHFPAKPDWDATGPIATWPEQWATDTLALSKQCFEGVKLGSRFVVPKDDKRDEHFEWKVTLAPGYDIKSRDIVEVELSKAGYRLAALFKAIWPEK